MRTRVLRLSIALLVGALVASGCSSGSDTSGPSGPTAPPGVEASIVTQAKAEGSVVFYSAYNAELSDAIGQAFQERYGIEVEVVRQASADLNARYAAEAEADAIVADVLWQPDDVFAAAATQEGWLDTLDPSVITNLDKVDEDDRTDTTVTTLKQPWGIAYNTSIMSADDAPKSWEDLSRGGKISGGLLLADPSNSVSTAAVYDLWLDEFGVEFFADVKDTQKFEIADSVSNAIQQVGGGEAAAFVPAPMSTVANAQEVGAPVDIVVPDLTTGFPMLGSISAEAPHPNAARLLLDFLLTADGQRIAVADFAIPVVEGIDSGVPLPSGYVPSNNERTAGRLDEIVRLLGT